MRKHCSFRHEVLRKHRKVTPRYREDLGRDGVLRAKIQARRAHGNSKAIARVQVDCRFRRSTITVVVNEEDSQNRRVYIPTERRRKTRTELTSVEIQKRKNIGSEPRRNMNLEGIQSQSVGTPAKQESDTTVGCTVALGMDNTGDNALRANAVEMMEICFSKLVLN
jgi:hypothetical protein